MSIKSRALRVLVVDDERDTLMTLGILLRSEGMDVRLATRAGEATALAAEFHPDVVLLDIGLPGRSGLQLALDLAREHGPRCPPLIAVTAHSDDAARRLTAKSGFRHHIAKPYDPDALIKLVGSIEPRD